MHILYNTIQIKLKVLFTQIITLNTYIYQIKKNIFICYDN